MWRQLHARVKRLDRLRNELAASLALSRHMEPPLCRPKRPKPGYEPIFVTPTESWTSGRFIDHFLISNHFAVSPANRELVRVVMRSYPGPRPIMAPDIAVYLLRHFNRPPPSIAPPLPEANRDPSSPEQH
jgi:hypothetical protein